MSKYTPEPWMQDSDGFVRLEDQCSIILDNANNEGLAWVPICTKDSEGISGIVALCHPINARLIAKAPELVEALREAYFVLAWTRNQWPGRSTAHGQALLCKLRDALVDATGEDAQAIQDSADGIARALLAEIVDTQAEQETAVYDRYFQP